ncbi:competence type IV pilus minor pilin ComGF [Heyndrickxia sp. NPDC080065]|uniref:competence type IV pilus minor pilin ComGF n=1 Tax=Heyndrickxia sp. NPDC080065 TaxID=3390568 RepID=UPI003D071337
MLSLLLISMILSFFPLFIKVFEQINHSLSTEEDYEWNLFVIQLRKELRISDKWKVTDNKLYLDVNDEKVMYEQYGNLIRRRVNEMGHEVVLQRVKAISITGDQNQIVFHVQFLTNHQKEAHHIPPSTEKQA